MQVASIQDYGNGWYRCIVSYDANVHNIKGLYWSY